MNKFLILLVSCFFTQILFAQNAPSKNDKIIEEKVVLLSKEVYFDFGKYEIREDAVATLKEVLEEAANFKDFETKITAHTDAIGTNENNMVLSQNRSNAVKDYLLENGFQSDSIEATVYGEESPVATNDTEEGRQQNRRATIDLFQIKKMYNLEGEVLSKETGEPVEAEVIVRTKSTKDTVNTDAEGKFNSLVPIGAVAGVDVYSKGFFLETKMFKATPEKTEDFKLELNPVKVGKKVDIENLYYVGNEAILLPRSEPELPKILKFMEVNFCAKIEIAGHVNVPNRPPVVKESWEYDLSVRRAKLVYDYLIKNKIAPERISFNGYGNWEMRYPNAVSERQQETNRRVEIRVLSVGVTEEVDK